MNDTTEENSKMDKIEKIGHSLIQHGKFNNRIYLMKFDRMDYPHLLPLLSDLAAKEGYSKIFAKIPESAHSISIMEGYVQEAYIPKFYQGNEAVFFMSKYLNTERSQITNEALTTLTRLLSDPNLNNEDILPENFEIKITEPRLARSMATIYQQVFKTYPFPITNASYLEKTMVEGAVIYFGIWDQGKLIGLSSAEMDIKNQNVEMTDFAVLSEYRGQKLASFLLKKMEKEMKKREFKTLYTIARLNSPGMTKTFINQGYHYSGLLKNNTNISGQIESMTVFYKNILK
jgi:lysine 2,3-aminomutase